MFSLAIIGVLPSGQCCFSRSLWKVIWSHPHHMSCVPITRHILTMESRNWHCCVCLSPAASTGMQNYIGGRGLDNHPKISKTKQAGEKQTALDTGRQGLQFLRRSFLDQVKNDVTGIKSSNGGTWGQGSFVNNVWTDQARAKITEPSRSSYWYASEYEYDGLIRSKSKIDLSSRDLKLNVTLRSTCISFNVSWYWT